jgi:predicted  nucleic acid-binding Zn-ribbon protein
VLAVFEHIRRGAFLFILRQPIPMAYDVLQSAFVQTLTIKPGRCFFKTVINGQWLLVPGHHVFADHRCLLNNLIEVQLDGSVKFFEDLTASYAALHAQAFDSRAELVAMRAQVTTLQADLASAPSRLDAFTAGQLGASELSSAAAEVARVTQHYENKLQQVTSEVVALRTEASKLQALCSAHTERIESTAAQLRQQEIALASAAAVEESLRTELAAAQKQAAQCTTDKKCLEDDLAARKAELCAANSVVLALQHESAGSPALLAEPDASSAELTASLTFELQALCAQRALALSELKVLKRELESPASRRLLADSSSVATPTASRTRALSSGRSAIPPWRSPMAPPAGGAVRQQARVVNSVAQSRARFAREARQGQKKASDGCADL